MKITLFQAVLLSCLTATTLAANAWDGIVTGNIASIDVTGGNNYGFRVALEGTPALCGNAHTWAFVNESDSNYQTFVAVLLAAKAAKQNVTLFTNKTGNEPDGYCHIGYIRVN